MISAGSVLFISLKLNVIISAASQEAGASNLVSEEVHLFPFNHFIPPSVTTHTTEVTCKERSFLLVSTVILIEQLEPIAFT